MGLNILKIQYFWQKTHTSEKEQIRPSEITYIF